VVGGEKQYTGDFVAGGGKKTSGQDLASGKGWVKEKRKKTMEVEPKKNKELVIGSDQGHGGGHPTFIKKPAQKCKRKKKR